MKTGRPDSGFAPCVTMTHLGRSGEIWHSRYFSLMASLKDINGLFVIVINICFMCMYYISLLQANKNGG